MPKQTINYALAATLVAQGVTLEEAALQSGAKNANSLRCGLARKGVTALQVRRSDHATERALSVATKVVSQASEVLRSDLASLLQKHVGALSTIPAKPNLKHIKAIGDAIEPLTRSAKIVHDWGSEQPNALILSGRFNAPTPQEQIAPVIDIQQVVDDAKPVDYVTDNETPSVEP